MIAGGIDLSVGSVVALVCVVMACWSLTQSACRGAGDVTLPPSPRLALIAGVLLGGLCGLSTAA